MNNPDYNPQLRDWQKVIPASEPGQGHIEQPGGFANPVWQTRKHAPSRFELDLVSALEAVFAEGATELDDVVAGLNKAGFHDRSGAAWTTESFQREMAVLGQ